ncbi:MAG TPA: hypothetical protein VMN57_07110 [Anaerolineales bacterium]|nr:hypothetical protein [Anaerolineales bacterium]
MANKSKNITPSDGGVFQNFMDRIRLILRLMVDRRVTPLIKVLPLGALLYLVVPDLAPGPLDDALILWLGSTVFLELCPVDVVAEHEDELRRTISGKWRDAEPDDVIEGDARDLDGN